MTKKKSSPFVKALVAIILIICILAALVVALFYGILGFGKKRAIIIVPGLFASALYDEDTGKAVWDPVDDVDLWLSDIISHNGYNDETIVYLLTQSRLQDEIFNHILVNNGHGDGESFLYRFTAMNEDGTSAFNIKPYPPEVNNRYKYGMMNAQTEVCQYFEEQYGETYDVFVFNYDFRLDNRVNGRLLQDYINKNGYEEIIFVSHSNGGLVVGSYLTLSEENRNKVDMHLSFDSPYLGSVTALTTLENLEDMIDGISDIADMLPWAFSEEMIQNAFHEQFLPMANMYTVYQLLPTYELFRTPQYYNLIYTYEHTPGKEPEKGFVEFKNPYFTMYNFDTGKMDEYYFESDEDLYDYYCSRPWAHLNNDPNADLRAGMKDWLDYTRSYYIETDDGVKHVTELVDTYYFSGIGYETYYSARYKKDGDAHHCVGGEYTDQGDGTVLLYSATAGTTDFSRIVPIPYADHYDVFQYFNDFSKEETERLLCDRLNWKQKILLKWNKNNRKEE